MTNSSKHFCLLIKKEINSSKQFLFFFRIRIYSVYFMIFADYHPVMTQMSFIWRYQLNHLNSELIYMYSFINRHIIDWGIFLQLDLKENSIQKWK